MYIFEYLLYTFVTLLKHCYSNNKLIKDYKSDKSDTCTYMLTFVSKMIGLFPPEFILSFIIKLYFIDKTVISF